MAPSELPGRTTQRACQQRGQDLASTERMKGCGHHTLRQPYERPHKLWRDNQSRHACLRLSHSCGAPCACKHALRQAEGHTWRHARVHGTPAAGGHGGRACCSCQYVYSSKRHMLAGAHTSSQASGTSHQASWRPATRAPWLSGAHNKSPTGGNVRMFRGGSGQTVHYRGLLHPRTTQVSGGVGACVRSQ